MIAKIKSWLEKHGIHAYKLPQDPGEKLHIFIVRHDDERCARFEYHRHGGFAFTVELHPLGFDEALSGHIALPFLGTLYWSFDHVKLSRFIDQYIGFDGFHMKDSRKFGFQLYEDFFWIYIHSPANSWSRSDPWWQSISINWKDILFGKDTYSRIESQPIKAKIFFPEKLRESEVTYSESTWKRPRWPWPKHSKTYDFDFTGDPIPIPGKGENSYDCDKDAVYTQSICVDKFEDYDEAVKLLQKKIAKTRESRGGADWSFAALLFRRGESEDTPPN